MIMMELMMKSVLNGIINILKMKISKYVIMIANVMEKEHVYMDVVLVLQEQLKI